MKNISESTEGNNVNTLLKVVPINAQKDFYEIEDGVRNWYKCPKCGDENVRFRDIYCEKCNCDFEWSGHKANGTF